MQNEYIVIDTWNGDGYSTENGVEIKTFSSRVEAVEHAKKRRDEQIKIDLGDKINEFGDYYFGWGDDEYGDHGSYQVHRLKENYFAVEIVTNINFVRFLTKKEYKQRIKKLHSEIFEMMYKALTLTIDNYYASTDLEEYITFQKNDENFYHGIGEFDYQYRFIK